MAALPQWELSMKVVPVLDLCGPWWQQMFRDMAASVAGVMALSESFLQASCSWPSEGLFG